jgi:Fuc2NAc and GlcNAc transferase
MTDLQFMLAWLLALSGTLILTPLLRRYLLAVRMVDHPGERRSHQRVTPRGGGLAMAAGLLLGLVVIDAALGQTVMLAMLVLALSLLGWLDDRHDLPVRWRLLAQLAVAAWLVISVGGVTVVEWAGHALAWPWLWSALALPAIIWLINLHNFMDGADGLAASQGAWTGLAFGVLFFDAGLDFEAAVALLLCAVCLGFLYWNRPVARLFMGDVGSVLIGGVVAWLAITGAATGAVSIWLSIVICSVFAVDATATLGRRLVSGERWYTAHRQHAYQRLLVAGWTHQRVLLLYVMINALVVLSAILVGVGFPHLDFWLALGVAVTLGLGWWSVQSACNGEQGTHD